MKVLGVIPARLRSTRLPEKMLADIEGKPLIYYTWRQAKKARLLDEIVVATDSKQIADRVREFGGETILTSAKIKTGSDRVAAVARAFRGFRPDIVVNIQGDEPLMPPRAIDEAVRILMNNPKAVMSTAATPFERGGDVDNPGFVKVVLDQERNALYFSRSRIPYERGKTPRYLKHIGLYAFRCSFLAQYVELPPTPLEKNEKLEQLRALEHGYTIKVTVGRYQTREVNTAADLREVRKIIRAQNKKTKSR